MPVVTNARSIIFVVVGLEKKEMVKRVLETPTQLPRALVNRAAGNRVKWFVDEPALEGVVYARVNSQGA